MGRGTPKNRKHVMADETAAGSRYGTTDFEEIDQLLGDVNARNTHKLLNLL